MRQCTCGGCQRLGNKAGPTFTARELRARQELRDELMRDIIAAMQPAERLEIQTSSHTIRMALKDKGCTAFEAAAILDHARFMMLTDILEANLQ